MLAKLTTLKALPHARRVLVSKLTTVPRTLITPIPKGSDLGPTGQRCGGTRFDL